MRLSFSDLLKFHTVGSEFPPPHSFHVDMAKSGHNMVLGQGLSCRKLIVLCWYGPIILLGVLGLMITESG